MPPIISIVGKSDSGKTTLLEKLLAEIKNRGYHSGIIKHDTHGFDIDHEGKDTWRHKKAGASTVIISSPNKIAVIRDIKEEKVLDAIAAEYLQDINEAISPKSKFFARRFIKSSFAQRMIT